MNHPVVEEELALLARVAKQLAEEPEPPAPSEDSLVQELSRLREALISGSDAKDAGALHQQWERQSALLRQLRSSRAAPRVDPRSPYFAHLRLEEERGVRDVCLGRATCIRDGVRIVDWRNAPVSKLFYRYQQGEEYEEEVAGRMRTGVVVARRSVEIHDDTLARVESPEGIFTRVPGEAGAWHRDQREAPRLAGGEASAMRAHAPGEEAEETLGSGAAAGLIRPDKHLREITGLMDPEQFSLITRPGPGFLLIRGSAGSGKTTVALHRIAYLAYDDPQVDTRRSLFLAFSPALTGYVGHVLPALGINNVRVLTWRDWAAEQRKRHFPQLPSAQREDAPALVQRMKLHPALASALAEQVRRVRGPRDVDQVIEDWTAILTERELLEEAFSREGDDALPADAVAQFVDWNRRALEELAAGIDGDPEARAELEPEDDALLLRAWQLRVGPLRYRGRGRLHYRHVAVDEVQDFAPLEIQVLLDCLDERRSITLAGDSQQQLLPHGGFGSWSELLARVGVRGTEVETLRVSYRSSREIVEFSRDLLGDLREDDEPPLTVRSGPPVELFRFTDRGACVAFLADALRALADTEPLASVAILPRSDEASALYFEGLAASDLPDVRRVRGHDFTFAPGVEVTEIEQAKGLEFDYVVLVDVTHASYPDDAASRRLLHVGATRAVHQLWMTSVGTPSPLVSKVEQR